MNSKQIIPLSLNARVVLEDFQKNSPRNDSEPFKFEFQIENIGSKAVVLNMWFAHPEVASLGPAPLVGTKKINVLRGKRRPPNESDILRLAPGDRKKISMKHWALETFPYYTRIKEQASNSDDSLAYILKGKGTYTVSFCWTFNSMTNPFLKSGEEFWQGQICSTESQFEVKTTLPKASD